MAKVDFTIAKCKDRAGFSAKPLQNVKLDLTAIKQQFAPIIDTPILLVIDCDGEIIVHQYGELLFKTLTDKKQIEAIARKVYGAAGLDIHTVIVEP